VQSWEFFEVIPTVLPTHIHLLRPLTQAQGTDLGIFDDSDVWVYNARVQAIGYSLQLGGQAA